MTARDLAPSLEPPIDLPEIQRGVWCPLPASDPVAAHLTSHYWDKPEPPAAWEVARLSQAVYLYRETRTHHAVVTKFYSIKTRDAAERHARQELELTQQARAAELAEGSIRALQPLGVFQGVLLLEYVNGLTLQDVIAVRRHRPGTLLPALQQAGELLATLHRHAIRPDASPDFATPLHKTRGYIETLVKFGVLADDPLIGAGLGRLIDRWDAKPVMRAYAPALTHGDATTTNFVYPWEGGVVGIDWERLQPGDPAADLGRLLAEVTHSITQHGGNVAEALPDIEYLADAYYRALPGDWDQAALSERARFYQAASTLRIARNGWVSRLDRTALVAQALALLADC
ncbi:MAG: aminoglycoside phosphotransferase family protein [Anaerolineae bacterium]|nr:aminoglycoside phosphotransferase family protein [Anaerolineae bacterium]